MIDNLRAYLDTIPAALRANRLREYLQWLVLRSLHMRGFYKHLAFVGGTALRIVYDVNRFSEDLDYSLIHGHDFTFRTLIDALNEDMSRLGLACSMSQIKDQKTVWSCFLKFSELLNPLGLSANPKQKLSLKIEIDANPPSGGRVLEHFQNGPIMFSVNHHDLPSLFAGKLHALLFRTYVKGRDYYDLLFFLSKKTSFNMDLLRNASRQTNPEVRIETIEDVTALLRGRLARLDDRILAADLAPFLLQPDEIHYVNSRNLIAALERNIASGVFEIPSTIRRGRTKPV